MIFVTLSPFYTTLAATYHILHSLPVARYYINTRPSAGIGWRIRTHSKKKKLWLSLVQPTKLCKHLQNMPVKTSSRPFSHLNQVASGKTRKIYFLVAYSCLETCTLGEQDLKSIALRLELLTSFSCSILPTLSPSATLKTSKCPISHQKKLRLFRKVGIHFPNLKVRHPPSMKYDWRNWPSFKRGFPFRNTILLFG